MPGLDAEARRDRLDRARLYLCTGMRPDLAEFADAALAGGVDILQLREKGGSRPDPSWPRSRCSPKRARATTRCSR